MEAPVAADAAATIARVVLDIVIVSRRWRRREECQSILL